MTTKPEQPPLSIEERVRGAVLELEPSLRCDNEYAEAILRRHFEDLGEARHRLEIKRDEDNGAKLDAVFLNGVPLHHFNRTQNAQAYLEKVRKALTADYDFDGLREQQSAESQRDIQELRLAGVASDHIWAMADGYEPHCIGLRMDSGDSGVVYMTPEQAHDVIDNLNSILWQLLEIPHASEQSTRGFSNISVNGAKVAGAQGSEPTEEQKRACPACSSIIPEEGHAKDCPDPAGEFSPSRTPERRIGPGERRKHEEELNPTLTRFRMKWWGWWKDARVNIRTGPPDRRRKPSQDSAIGDETSQRPTEKHGESDLALDSHAPRGSAAQPGKKEEVTMSTKEAVTPRCPECLSDCRTHGNLRECTNAWHSYVAQVTAPQQPQFRIVWRDYGSWQRWDVDVCVPGGGWKLYHAANATEVELSSLLAERDRTITELRGAFCEAHSARECKSCPCCAAVEERIKWEQAEQERNALKGRLTALEIMVSATGWGAAYGACREDYPDYAAMVDRFAQRIAKESEATAERLRGLLRKVDGYAASHKVECALRQPSASEKMPDCDCGLDALRQRIQKELEP